MGVENFTELLPEGESVLMMILSPSRQGGGDHTPQRIVNVLTGREISRRGSQINQLRSSISDNPPYDIWLVAMPNEGVFVGNYWRTGQEVRLPRDWGYQRIVEFLEGMNDGQPVIAVIS